MKDVYDILVTRFDGKECADEANRRRRVDTRSVIRAQHVTALDEGQWSTDVVWEVTRSVP